jgi:hypothetical protein
MPTRHRASIAAFSAFTAAIAALAQGAWAQPYAPQPFVVTEPKAVQAAEALFQDVQSLAQLVGPCVAAATGTAVECVCRFPSELGRVQRSVRSVQAQYPDWNAKLVNWTDPGSKQSRAISLEAIARQSSTKCPVK